ncbi:dTDP-4-dehydrorhamnose 3,5-epimerase family protein [Streptomyces sp. MJM1172]|uniref:dTDP-4-dehydrorhamnose 3,5-epimerase family protein n=1 Tax=Streptomyces sp. MJM1172 TaxID=1703926 RepID=UPI00093DABE1|nr:dTDP-4-dehydrorhamnose 3,5-epimerase family protein [Streptomyces sp. MJM1172]OKI61993.1 dTDP-4-dehydrorhamnose 3,5-epimerase [Streptomyces sp. MJM1172]
MDVAEARVPGAFVFTPERIRDERGSFFEAFRGDHVEAVTGRPFRPEQINYSVSRRNTLRGVHAVAVPPGQAKYVTCVRGALRDIVVDLRVGSPAFGEYHVTSLDAGSGRCVYVPEGVGHGFLSLTDDACICYVVSTRYVSGTQIDIDPLDPDLALPWGFSEPPLMSAKDATAPGVRAALAEGLLAHWRDVRRPAS